MTAGRARRGRLPPGGLDAWIARQRELSAAGLLRCISRTDLSKHRPELGRTVRPTRGSILASPGLGDYDPEPDYFFHWVRDSALVVDALRQLHEGGDRTADWPALLHDFLTFTRGLARLDGSRLVTAAGWPPDDAAEARLVRRPAAELAAIRGDRVAGDVRYNPDGTLDVKPWARPQHDGPALRALALLRWRASAQLTDPATLALLDEQIQADLAFVDAHRDERCFDLWEEKLGRHYHTILVQLAALEAGAQRLRTLDRAAEAGAYAAAAAALAEELDATWQGAARTYRARRATEPPDPSGYVDLAVILAVVQTGRRTGRHSILDDRIHATMERLEAVFAAEYPLNRGARHGGLAYGRYPGDRYLGGGPYLFMTLGAAELYFRMAEALYGSERLVRTARNRAWLRGLAPAPASRRAIAAAVMARGDAILAVVRRLVPRSGTMSEQADQTTGEPLSALDLGWSYAAFISATTARDRALRARR